MAKNGNLRLLLLQVIQADQLADLHPPQVEASNGQECQLQIAIVTGHIGRLTDRSPSPGRGIQWPRMAISDCYCYRSYRQINWTDLPLSSRGIQWPTMAISDCYCYRSYRHINWQMYLHPKQRHLMANIGNFTLLLLQVIQAYQLDRCIPSLRGIQWSRMAISDFYWYRSYRQIN